MKYLHWTHDTMSAMEIPFTMVPRKLGSSTRSIPMVYLCGLSVYLQVRNLGFTSETASLVVMSPRWVRITPTRLGELI